MKGVINTMVCEQTNSDVVCYKNSTKQMNCARYNFFFLYYSTIEIKVSWMELIIRVMIIIKKGESVRVMMFNFSKQQFHLKIILLLKKNLEEFKFII